MQIRNRQRHSQVPIKKIAAGALVVFACLSFRSSAVLVHRLNVLPESQLFIEGKTNVNTFTCAIKKYTGTDTLVLQEGGKNTRPVFVNGLVHLNASNFECGLALITNDFRKTVKAEEHPAIIIDFLSVERMPSYIHEETFNVILKIILAGTSKVFEVPCALNRQPDGTFHLLGGKNFTFSEFELTPASRMLGAVKVKDDIYVKFHLVLALLPE